MTESVLKASSVTAEMNKSADLISGLSEGDGVTVSVWTTGDAYTIVRKTPSIITLRFDNARLINKEEQRYAYSPNPLGQIIKITLRRYLDQEGNERRKWKHTGTCTTDNTGTAKAGRHSFYDWNHRPLRDFLATKQY